MTKLCSVCGTENREEAQFCRACGGAFAAQAARNGASDGGATQNVCAECGFQNKPGLRYCANCGMGLAAPSSAAPGPAVPSPGEPLTGVGPPPISYPSFATVAPYPPAPAGSEQTIPDIPDPDAAIALRQQEADASAAMPFESAPARNRAPLVIGIAAVVLVVASALAWTFMRDSNPSPPVIGATTPPVAAPLPASAVATTPIIVERATASNPAPVAGTASAVETPTAAAPTAGALETPPAAAARLPQVTDPVQPESAEAEARRVAAERRREKAARDKADREAKALLEQRDQSAAAAQRAEQEAQARRRAEEAQRSRPSAVAPPPTPLAAQPRGVREICAGRGTIAEAVCQSRQCGSPEHANEPICRQLREQDERRRSFQN